MPSAKRKLPACMTVDEFIAWPGDGENGRYELVDGELRARSPASATHGVIQASLGRMIGNHLDTPGSRCRVVTEPAVHVRLTAKGNMRVPDLGVSCARILPGDVALPDPILLIEILAPGNTSDTWDNIRAYATLPSVREILIVSSTRIFAHLLRRQSDGSWPPDPEPIAAEGTLHLETIALTAPLREVFAGTYLVETN